MTTVISAMDLRGEPGRYLDRADYKNEIFIIERAGEPKAALVPMAMLSLINQAKERFFKMTGELRQSFLGENPKKVEEEIEKAVQKTRN